MDASFHDELAARYQGARSRLMGTPVRAKPVATVAVKVQPRPLDWKGPVIAGRAHFAWSDHLLAVDSTRWEQIAEEVCHKYGVAVPMLAGRSRIDRVSKARNEVFYRLRYETELSLARIGAQFNRDHSSVAYGSARHAEVLAKAQTG